MHWTKNKYLLLMFLLIGCQLDTHNNPYDSPFDVDGNKKLGIFPPALTLYPKDAKVNVQESVDMSVYVSFSVGLGVVRWGWRAARPTAGRPGEMQGRCRGDAGEI